jgi:hypothetical protein
MTNYIESRAKNFKFGQVGDFMKGTLTKVSRTTTPDQYGKLSHIYTVIAEEGSYLDSSKNEKTGKFVQDKEPTAVIAGAEYTIFVSDAKGIVIGKMKDIKIGQKFMIKFDELKPTTKGNDAKIIKVYPGYNKDESPALEMDKAWLETQNPSQAVEYDNAEFEGATPAVKEA